MAAIGFDGTITLADAFRASLIIVRPAARQLAIVAVGIALLIVVVPFFAPYIPVAMMWTVVALYLGISATFLGFYVCLSAFRTRKMQADAGVITYEFSASGVDFAMLNARSHLEWPYFRGYFISGDLALLAVPHDNIVIVPRRCAAPKDLEDLDALLAAHLKRLK